MLGKLQRAHPILRCHFAPPYLVGSNMLRAYLFFIYGFNFLPYISVGATAVHDNCGHCERWHGPRNRHRYILPHWLPIHTHPLRTSLPLSR